MAKPYVQIFAGTSTTYQHSALETQSPPASPTRLEATATPNTTKAYDHDDVVTIEPNSDVEYNDLLPTTRLTGYDYFETLSLVYSAIESDSPSPNHELNPVLQPLSDHITDDPRSARNSISQLLPGANTDKAKIARWNPNCAYVNGVDTPGIGVGTHIVNNLMCVFDAIARGHDDIMLLGHSRGAVAAILAAHELNSIKDSHDTDLLKILNETTCQYTKAALANLTIEQKDWLKTNSKTIIDSIRGQQQKPATKFSLFGIDPVPGTISPITWIDDRFFKIPPIISEAEIIIMEDERTGVFRPILPTAQDPNATKIKTTVLRGNHATASGNLNNQQKTLTDGLNKNRRHVQKLTLAKIAKMLTFHGVKLKKRFKNRFDLNQQQRLELYHKIHNNSEAYTTLQNHTYSLLSSENNNKHRLVYTKDMLVPIALGSHIPQIPGYVNSEHLLLSLQRLFTLNEQYNNPVDALRAITGRIQEFAALAGQANGHQKEFKGMLSGLVHTISMTYLRNNLTSEEKQNLMHAVTHFLQELNKQPNNPLIKEIYQHTIEEIATTIDTRLAILKSSLDFATIEFSKLSSNRHFDETKDTRITKELLHGICKTLEEECNELTTGLEEFQNALKQAKTPISTLQEKILLNKNTSLQIKILLLQNPLQKTMKMTKETQCETTRHCSYATQTESSISQAIQNKITEDFCKNAVEKLKHACDVYLKHAAIDEAHYIGKRKVVEEICARIKSNRSATENFTAISFYLKNNPNSVTALQKNLQSKCEFACKILAVLTGFFGIVLAAKRLYDSGGKSINFFKPLSSCIVIEPINTMLYMTQILPHS